MRARSARAVRAALLLGTGAVALFPFYWMLRTAFAPADEVYFSGISLFPTRIGVDNFVRAWVDADLGRAMVNGAVVTLAILVCQLLTCVPAAYAFAKLRFRGRDRLYIVVLAALLVPVQATALPTYLGMSALDLVDTRVSLVLPFVTSAFGIFLIRQYMVTIPDAVLEAARSDGLGHAQRLLRVVAPMSMPAILAFAVFSVFAHWNDYLWPLLVARSPELRTPPLALAVFSDAELGVDFGAVTAGAAIVTLPIVALFIVAQRRFVAGIAGGEVVG
ncbi:MAG: carbohydrate ABC transporter permease [Pseudonocardiales bacterium]|jgi:multiple sugar transport system permease protein|nr:carbohydrate ABC transporter permease [Pseudonocardiales bacterium]